MEYRIEIGCADTVGRHNKALSKNWESIATGETLEELIECLLEAANDEYFNISNSWLRFRKGTKVTTF